MSKRTFTQQPATTTKKTGKLKLEYTKIQKGDIIAVCKEGKDGFTESEVNSNTQIHQKTMSPLSPDGQFYIDLTEPAMFSNFLLSKFTNKNEKTGYVENQVTLKTFMDIYGDYAELDANGNHTTDSIGDSYIEAFKLIDESICESIDADPVHKKRLLGCLKLGKNLKTALDTPLIQSMEPFISRSTDEDKSSPTFGEEDMTKSPTGKFMLWVGRPQTPAFTDFKIPGTDLVLWTRIFDDTERVASKPIQTWEHLMKFIYEKGDSQTKGKRPFRFSATCTALAPSVYYNSEKGEEGRAQYKIAEMHIYQIDYAKSRNTMSPEEMAFQNTLKIKAMRRFVITPKETTEDEEEEHQHGEQQQLQLTYDNQPQQQQSEHGDGQQQIDFDNMIAEDEEMQRTAKKQRF